MIEIKKYKDKTLEEKLTTVVQRRDDFFKRLEEISIAHKVIAIPEESDNEEEEKWKLEIKDWVDNKEQVAYTLMGLIAHFNNRKWISGWSYMYIMKTHQRIKFSAEDED